MADTAALLLNADGNVDRVRTTDGSVYVIESTFAREAADACLAARADAITATEDANTAAALAKNAASSAASTVRDAAQLAANAALLLVQGGGTSSGDGPCGCAPAIAALGSIVADLKGGFFYIDGCVYAPSSKASISGTTVTLGSSCSASGTTITLA